MRMIEAGPAAKLTPSEIKAQTRASKQKPKAAAKKCAECKGVGEVHSYFLLAKKR